MTLGDMKRSKSTSRMSPSSQYTIMGTLCSFKTAAMRPAFSYSSLKYVARKEMSPGGGGSL